MHGFQNHFSNLIMKSFSVVVAVCQGNNGIGYNGKLPWRNIRADFENFRHITIPSSTGRKNIMIMGRSTWKSIPKKALFLTTRHVIVLSSCFEGDENAGLYVKKTFTQALQFANSSKMKNSIDQIMVLGGQSVYEEALKHPLCETIHQTIIYKNYECDRYFPEIPSSFRVVYSSSLKTEKSVSFCFTRWVRVRDPSHEENQYLTLVDKVLEDGDYHMDRTGTGTLSVFGAQMRFNLREYFPLLTTKRVFFRGVVEELLWMMRGSTNSKELDSKQVRIWNDNGSRKYLDSIGLQHRKEGDLGPVYGFQWRHFGAEYKDCDEDYTGEGVDQLKEVIRLIREDPSSRRIILTAWNPLDLKDMALPPCHMMCQFYVSNGFLSCHMYQRSCDLGLGVPFNIASYSLLTNILACHCDLKPGNFVYSLGDAHIYKNHVEALKVQLDRSPRVFPTLRMNQEAVRKDLMNLSYSDFSLVNYSPYEAIDMKMAV